MKVYSKEIHQTTESFDYDHAISRDSLRDLIKYIDESLNGCSVLLEESTERAGFWDKIKKTYLAKGLGCVVKLDCSIRPGSSAILDDKLKITILGNKKKDVENIEEVFIKRHWWFYLGRSLGNDEIRKEAMEKTHWENEEVIKVPSLNELLA